MSLTTTRLPDGISVHCLRRAEAHVLDHHIQGYLDHEVTLQDGDIVFDVGANIGLLGVRACLRYPQVQVFAFEPVPRIFAACQENARQHGGGRMHALNIGLSHTPGEARFTWFPHAPALSTARPEDWNDGDHWKQAVRGQLEAMPPQLWWAKLVPGFLLGVIAWGLRRNAEQVVCPLQTVSLVMDQHAVPRIDLLKIDCEGFELDVLRGVAPRHWPLIQQVVVEVNDQGGRADTIEALLRGVAGFAQVSRRKEDAFRDTPLVNLYASRRGEGPVSATGA